ncbi:hypothetical protein EC957_008892, partial [Mortierella hygrophila]
MLMIEGPKFSGFDFSSSSQGGEPFEINGHRIILPPKEAEEDSTKDIKEGDQSGSQDAKEVPPPPTSLSHTASTAKSVWDC